MSTTVKVQIQQRIDSSSNWTTANPTLLAGEVGWESNTKKYKIGDGSTAWASLTYAPGSGGYTAGTGVSISASNVITASAIALSTIQTAANETAMLALTTQEGDVVVRSDQSKTYMKNSGTAGSMADFTELATPTDAVTSVAGNTGVVTDAHIAAAVESATDSNTFTDADHTKLNSALTTSDLLDEDDFATDSATKAPSQQSVKAYVDTADALKANLGANTFTGNQSLGDNLKVQLGTGNDLDIFHDSGSTKSMINNQNGELRIVCDNAIRIGKRHDATIAYADNMIVANPDGAVELYWDGTKKIETTTNGITVTGTVTDSKGDLRSIPQLSKSAQHTIVAADSGKHSINSSGGWVINTSTGFTAGQAITLINNSGSDQTITNTGCTMYLAGDTSSKSSLTLKGRGMATFLCTDSNVYYGSGAGLE